MPRIATTVALRRSATTWSGTGTTPGTVCVGFAGRTAPPTAELTSWHPALPLTGGRLQLPGGAGSITFTAKADPGRRYAFTWTYRDEPLLSHLGVTATGPGGTAELKPFGRYYDRHPTIRRRI